MLSHGARAVARRRLRVGDGPFVEMGIGMDLGEAFVGNIGQRALYDSPRSGTSSHGVAATGAGGRRRDA